VKIKGLLTGIVLTACGSANAVVFSPTNQNVNFFNVTISGSGLIELAMFDDSAFDSTGFLGGDWLNINIAPPDNGDVVDFTPGIGQNSNYTVTNNDFDVNPSNVFNQLTLTDNDHFRLAARRGIPGDTDFIPWSEASDFLCTPGTESCTMTWNLQGTVLGVDMQVATPIPVPPAVWLFGSGLLGLVGIARRRRG